MRKLKIKDLGPRTRKAATTIKIVEKLNEKDIISKKDGLRHKIAEFLAGDNTGCIILSLWDNQIDEIKEGCAYEIKNCYVHVFKNSMRLNLSRTALIEEINAKIKVNTENNKSEQKIRIPGKNHIPYWNQPFNR